MTEKAPAFALVVDDNEFALRMACSLVARSTGLEVETARDGREAVEILKRGRTILVLTDLRMPKMDGLAVVEHIAAHHPSIPVVLMTAEGSEEIAIQALKAGAASYVPKGDLNSLYEILPALVNRAKIERRRHEVYRLVDHLECDLALPNDPTLIELLIGNVREYLQAMKIVEATDMIRVSVALEEAILNGIYHGNLEVDSHLKESGSDAFHRLVEERRLLKPYCDRRLQVRIRLRPDEARFSICDEGSGFDPSVLPDPTDPENVLKASGRGLLLIRTFMDEVVHEDGGRKIIMVKRRAKLSGESPVGRPS